MAGRRKKVRPGSISGGGRRLSFTELSGAADEDLPVSLVGSNLHAFTVADLHPLTTSSARTGSGLSNMGFVDKPGLKAQAIAVKLWDLEGAQGHKEWLVGDGIIKKRIHVYVEHVQPSRC